MSFISSLFWLLHLQLGFGLGLLEDGLHLSGLHHVALDLQLSSHEEALGVGLAGDETAEVGVREAESDYAHSGQ